MEKESQKENGGEKITQEKASSQMMLHISTKAAIPQLLV